MIFYMTSGILMAWTLLIIMGRMNLRRFLGYPAIMDVMGTLILGALLHGTLGGMIAAISGGLFLSLIITVLRHYIGYEVFNLRTGSWTTTLGTLNYAVEGEIRYSPVKLMISFWPVMILIGLGFVVML